MLSLSARLSAFALVSVAAMGCAPSFDHLDFTKQTAPPLAVTLTSTEIEVPAGVAVAFTPIAMAGQDKLDKSVVVLTSTDPSILGVAPQSTAGGFLIFGVSHGTAGVNVLVDGEQKTVIHAVVSPQ